MIETYLYKIGLSGFSLYQLVFLMRYNINARKWLKDDNMKKAT